LRNERRLLAVIIVLGVVIRVVLGLVHPYVFDDSRDYVALAVRLLGEGVYGVQTKAGWVTGSRMPGYPLFLAGIFAVFGESLRMVAVVQGVLGAGVIGLTYALARRAGPAAGLLAAGMVAVDPLTVAFSAAILSEMPFTLFLLGALWACVRTKETRGWAWWIVLGVLWGGAVHLRASALWLLVPLAVWAGWPRKLVGVVTAVVVAGALLLPWFLRNGVGLRVTSMEGISLYESVYGGADGGPRQDKLVAPAEMAGMGEWERDAAWQRMAWAEMRAHPGRVAELMPVKVGRTWSPWMNAAEIKSVWVQAGMVAWQVPLFGLALAGIFLGRLGRWEKGLLLVPVVYFTVVHSVFLGSVRYRVPLMPVVCVFAAVGVVRMVERVGRDKVTG
jgi:4-amino-4-deoxy-L-arabinose transferase-like glycosyltransferase